MSPLLLNSWVFTFFHHLVQFSCLQSHYFGIQGPCPVTDLRFLEFSKKWKKISKNRRADFFLFFFMWVVANYHSHIFSGFLEGIMKYSSFFMNRSVFLKISHFVQSWRKRAMNSIENEALIETFKCLYHIYRSKTSLSTLLCRLNSSVTNILLLNTFLM